MIGLPAGTRIWIAAGVTDPRRGFTGLSGMVQTTLQENPFSGLLVSRGRRGGYMLLYCLFDKKHLVAERVRKLGAIPTEFAFERNGMQTWRVHEASSGL